MIIVTHPLLQHDQDVRGLIARLPEQKVLEVVMFEPIGYGTPVYSLAGPLTEQQYFDHLLHEHELHFAGGELEACLWGTAQSIAYKADKQMEFHFHLDAIYTPDGRPDARMVVSMLEGFAYCGYEVVYQDTFTIGEGGKRLEVYVHG
jgi:hypothetical protein